MIGFSLFGNFTHFVLTAVILQIIFQQPKIKCSASYDLVTIGTYNSVLIEKRNQSQKNTFAYSSFAEMLKKNRLELGCSQSLLEARIIRHSHLKGTRLFKRKAFQQW